MNLTGGEPGLRLASGPGRWVLFATVLGSAMASIDATVVGIALPAIGRDFDASLAALQWVVTAYTLTLAGLLLVAGTLGDRYGRRLVFIAGVIWFAISMPAFSATPHSTEAIANQITPAIGAWSGFAGVGTAIGPFL